MVNASTAGEDCCHRIGIPIDKGLVTRRVDIPYHLFHDVPVVDRNISEVLWHMGEGIDPNSVPSIPISKVGNILKISPSFDCQDELEQRLLRRISPDHKIDEGILT
jgi:hypothetical protein